MNALSIPCFHHNIHHNQNINKVPCSKSPVSQKVQYFKSPLPFFLKNQSPHPQSCRRKISILHLVLSWPFFSLIQMNQFLVKFQYQMTGPTIHHATCEMTCHPQHKHSTLSGILTHVLGGAHNFSELFAVLHYPWKSKVNYLDVTQWRFTCQQDILWLKNNAQAIQLRLRAHHL